MKKEQVLAEFRYNMSCDGIVCGECDFKNICEEAINADLENIDISDEGTKPEEFKEKFKDYINKYWGDVL